MKNIMISENQFERLLNRFSKIEEQQKTNQGIGTNLHGKYSISDVNNPLNTGKVKVDDPKIAINNIFKVVKDNSQNMNLPKNELTNLAFLAKQSVDTKSFLSDVDEVLGKYGFHPHISITKGDSGFELKKVGLEFNIPNLKGSTGSINIGNGKVMLGAKFSI